MWQNGAVLALLIFAFCGRKNKRSIPAELDCVSRVYFNMAPAN